MPVRIRSVQHEKRLIEIRAGFHHILKCGAVRIESGPDIPDIEYHKVDPLQIILLWFIVLPEGNDGNAGSTIFPSFDMFSSGRLAPVTMFGCEYATDVNTQ